ncbi:hypothetical protein SUGI_1114790 [Cryptomeria japonica]|nr:hypothetical protein SUGI_1114790 [Cryptomeria japonica]
MPVEIEGLRGLPLARDELSVVATEERARKLSNGRKTRFEVERIKKKNEEAAKMSDLVDEGVEKVEMALIVKLMCKVQSRL